VDTTPCFPKLEKEGPLNSNLAFSGEEKKSNID
jgi:hypothetical protein